MTTLEIRGFVVGPIWWPVGTECFKELSYNVTHEDARMSGPGTLRDHVLCATNDGDFQSCAIACGELIATSYRKDRKVVRSWPLERFPSVSDCLHPDPDWCPQFPEDFD